MIRTEQARTPRANGTKVSSSPSTLQRFEASTPTLAAILTTTTLHTSIHVSVTIRPARSVIISTVNSNRDHHARHRRRQPEQTLSWLDARGQQVRGLHGHAEPDLHIRAHACAGRFVPHLCAKRYICIADGRQRTPCYMPYATAAELLYLPGPCHADVML